jgi:hypothetical protein
MAWHSSVELLPAWLSMYFGGDDDDDEEEASKFLGT